MLNLCSFFSTGNNTQVFVTRLFMFIHFIALFRLSVQIGFLCISDWNLIIVSKSKQQNITWNPIFYETVSSYIHTLLYSNLISGNQFQSDRSGWILCSFFTFSSHIKQTRQTLFVENMLNVFTESRLRCCKVQVKWNMTIYCWSTHLFEF